MMNSFSTQVLKFFLADIYALSMKTHNFHWNVTGPQFYSLHILFENQYKSLLETANLVAERIRAAGERAPGGLKVYANLTSLKEPDENLEADAMLATLISDNEKLADTANTIIEKSFKSGDNATAEILLQRLHIHESQTWTMRALRKGKRCRISPRKRHVG